MIERNESSFEYPNIVLKGDKWRVVRCKDDIQYIYQTEGVKRYYSQSYFVNLPLLKERYNLT